MICGAGDLYSPRVVGMGAERVLSMCSYWSGDQRERTNEWMGLQRAAHLPHLLWLLQRLPPPSWDTPSKHYQECSLRWVTVRRASHDHISHVSIHLFYVHFGLSHKKQWMETPRCTEILKPHVKNVCAQLRLDKFSKIWNGYFKFHSITPPMSKVKCLKD